jgi:hypothetical protein
LASSGNNGIISPGNATLYRGDSLKYTFLPNIGYHIDSVLIDEIHNANAAAAGFYTFTNIAANHTIRVTFAIDTLMIAATAGKNGTIAPNGNTTLTYGSSQTFNFTPNIGYHIDSVFVNGTYNSGAVAAGLYTFIYITTNHTIRVTFAIDTFMITARAEANGMITPAGNTVVNYGDSLTFRFAPDIGYHIDSVFVDDIYNENAIADDFYSFNNITENHNIRVTFAIDTFIIIATAGTGGTITPNGKIVVNYGDSLTFHFNPVEGYSVSLLLVDSVNLPVSNDDWTYTFNFIVANRSIHVDFIYTDGIAETQCIVSYPKIYPNPTTGQLIIDNGQLTIDNVEIYDVFGRKIVNYQLSIVNYQLSIVNSIDISHLPNGIYFLRIQTNDGVLTKKLIKN